MRHVLGFAALMALLTVHARAADFAVKNNCPRFAVVNNTARVSTSCNCSVSGKCVCWEDECRCAACGRGGAAAAPKASSGTTGTAVRSAATNRPPGPAPGLSAASPAPSISTNAPGAYRLGGTDCASGNCPSATSYRRGLIFGR